MKPVNSEYIFFIESQTTITTTPWHQLVSKWEADKDVEVWRKAWLIGGCDLKDLGVDIEEEHYDKFFNIGDDPTMQQFVNKQDFPEGNVVFETYISCQS